VIGDAHKGSAMQSMKHLALVALFVAMAPAAAFADVKVNFVNPERYTDANLRHSYGKSAKEPTMREIEKYLSRLGDAHLAPGDKLTIDVIDIDLAGRFEPWQFNYQDVRFMREITWPAIKLRYSFERANGAPIDGEDTVTDKGYLTFLSTRDTIDIMPHEKAMLERWFRMRFARAN
jgi:hypothetical protein